MISGTITVGQNPIPISIPKKLIREKRRVPCNCTVIMRCIVEHERYCFNRTPAQLYIVMLYAHTAAGTYIFGRLGYIFVPFVCMFRTFLLRFSAS